MLTQKNDDLGIAVCGRVVCWRGRRSVTCWSRRRSRLFCSLTSRALSRAADCPDCDGVVEYAALLTMSILAVPTSLSTMWGAMLTAPTLTAPTSWALPL
eukprot:1443320-Pyramimonas_sp.AAC.1